MRRRSKVSAKRSKRIFKTSANKTHVKNVGPRPQRGGGRL